MSYLIDFITQILTWLLHFVDWIVMEVFQLLCTAVAAIIGAIPMPSWWTQAGTSLSQLPPGVLFFCQMLDLPTLLTVAVSAYGLRFLIRRIPFVG